MNFLTHQPQLQKFEQNRNQFWIDRLRCRCVDELRQPAHTTISGRRNLAVLHFGLDGLDTRTLAVELFECTSDHPSDLFSGRKIQPARAYLRDNLANALELKARYEIRYTTH